MIDRRLPKNTTVLSYGRLTPAQYREAMSRSEEQLEIDKMDQQLTRASAIVQSLNECARVIQAKITKLNKKSAPNIVMLTHNRKFCDSVRASIQLLQTEGDSLNLIPEGTRHQINQAIQIAQTRGELLHQTLLTMASITTIRQKND